MLSQEEKNKPKKENVKNNIFNLLLTLCVLIFTNCTNDDTLPPIETLHGTWHLININGGFAGIDDDYNPGTIIWTFNSESLTIDVDNNSSQENIYSGFESGTYLYSIVENNSNDYILINEEEFGNYIISVNELIIDQNEIQDGVGADGFILQFER